ncbi:hypothetical protein [Streptomyces sp. H27-H5]|uniref:hypothetical protein n=1 Tax=Streptomyces sp. H27-H5 TaxID=2996460 RepID=UPI00226DEDDF|nr:hypothetical protein [Streptomyces sp. H27-H5]MCY0961570.1 hypothetical protein [Streptomyces sp. H27-H5]
MAALALTVVPVATGLTLDTSAVTATALGDTAPCGSNRFLYVFNGDASSKTVTVNTPGTVSGVAIANVAVTVAAGKTAAIPLTNIFRGADGRASITYDSVTAVKVACFELGT